MSNVEKFKMDSLGDHVPTCTTHSGVKENDLAVEELADLSLQEDRQVGLEVLQCLQASSRGLGSLWIHDIV